MQVFARASGSLLAFAARSHSRAAAILLLFALLAFLPGFFTMQPMDRDEPRFAQATKQMLETGDFIDIRFQDVARHKKPVGIYWLQAAVVSAAEKLGVDDARRQIWLYRLPSLLGALAAVLLSYWAALALLPRREAFLAALTFGATILIGVEARLAKTDAVLCATAVAAFAIVARLWVLRKTAALQTWEVFAFWIAMGVTFLIKGPMIPLTVAMAMAVLCWRDRSSAWLRPLGDWRGILLCILIVLPWFIAITLKTGGEFFIESVRDDLLGKVAAGQETHGAPPGAYLLMFPATFWPASALAYLALPYVWRNRTDDVVLLCLAWIIPTWIMFELIPTKLPHYLLPVFPAIAVLVVKAMADGSAFASRGWRAAILWLMPLLPILFAVAASLATERFEPGGGARFLPLLWSLPLLGLALLLTLIAARLVRRDSGLAALPYVAAATLALSWSVYQFAWPALRSIQLSPRLAAAVSASGCQNPRVATVGGYNEPSLVFLTRSDLLMTMGRDAASFMAGEGCRVALVANGEEAAFLDAAKTLGLALRLVTRVEGVNINRAFERNSMTPRRVDIGVYLRDTSRP